MQQDFITNKKVIEQALDALKRLSVSQGWRKFVPDPGCEDDPWKPAEQYGLDAIGALEDALSKMNNVMWECPAGGLKMLNQRQYDAQPDNIKRHYVLRIKNDTY